MFWGRSGKPIYVSDGDAVTDGSGGSADPDAELTFAERKAKKDIGAAPDIGIFFRLADEPELGIFQFKTGSWGLAHDLAAEDVAGKLEAAEGPSKAVLSLTPESFVAKNGPMKGKTVSFVKSSLELVD